MTLTNKITPSGDIVAVSMRGLFMGNRGGRIHVPETRMLFPSQRWASRQWICCVISFKNRHREVMTKGYTELFFLDEVTAFAAGHRPCFECRRKDAKEFSALWADACGLNRPPRAGEMDLILHEQRLDGRDKRLFEADIGGLPDGAMIILDGQHFAVHKEGLLRWAPSGYTRVSEAPIGQVSVLTPSIIIDILKAGYQPRWHQSALDQQ